MIFWASVMCYQVMAYLVLVFAFEFRVKEPKLPEKSEALFEE